MENQSFFKYSIKILFFINTFVVLAQEYSYPSIPADSISDIYHNITVVDPYRSLENLQDSTVIDWLYQQNEFATDVLNRISGRDALAKRLVNLDTKSEFVMNYIYALDNGMYFYTKLKNADDPPKIYFRKGINGKEEFLFDLATYSDSNTYHLNHMKPDYRGEYLVLSLVKTGEEISELIIFDLDTKKPLPVKITNCKASIGGVEWLSDNSGFRYTYVENIDPTKDNYAFNSKSVIYKLGTDPKERLDVFSSESAPEANIQPEDFPSVSNLDERDGYLFGFISGSGSFREAFIKRESEIFNSKLKWKRLYSEDDKIEKAIIQGDDLIYLTAKNASNFKLCKTSLQNPDYENPEVLLAEISDQILSDFIITNDGNIFVTTVKNGIEAYFSKLEDGRLREIKLPKPSGSIYIRNFGSDHELIRISSMGFLKPSTFHIYNPKNESFKFEPIYPVPDTSEFDSIVLETIEVPSYDGTLIPVTILRPEKIEKDKAYPTWFTGYGSYGASGTYYSPIDLTWVAMGGILVHAHVRGGGEKGVEWHNAGRKTTKMNTWKDMIAVTQYIQNKGYTTPEKSVIFGISAGGILAGRAMTERPDLYKVALFSSPSLNLLRSEIQPNGKNSVKEFGTVEDKEEFKALLDMDTYHSINPNIRYPATLVQGGFKDGRVVIWDPAKFVARLQANNPSNTPVLFSINFDNGHAAISASRRSFYESMADFYAFALWQIGHSNYQIKNNSNAKIK